MSTLNDSQFIALRSQGYVGTNNDMLLQWALANGGSKGLNSALMGALAAQGGTGTLNDRWMQVLGAIGFTGTLNDRLLGFWESGGSFSAEALDGWTGSALCAAASVVLVTVEFSTDITYTSHAGVAITHDNLGTFTITGSPSTPSPTKVIDYAGTWNVAPVEGDVVTFTYTAAAGNYEDSSANPMADQTLELKNCYDFLPVLDAPMPDIPATVGVAIEPYDVSQNWTNADSYVLNNAPAWLTLTNGIWLIGEPTDDTDTAGITITATNAVGSTVSNVFATDVSQTIPIFDGVVPPIDVVVGVPVLGYDTSIHFQTGGPVSNYALIQNIPGVNINAITGVIEGTPTEVGAGIERVNASNTGGIAQSNQFDVNISAALGVPVFEGTIADMVTETGVAMVPYPVAPHFANGGAVELWSLQNAPSWMSIDGLGFIVGTPDVDAITAGVTATGTNTAGADASNAFSVEAAGLVVFTGILEHFDLEVDVPITGYDVSTFYTTGGTVNTYTVDQLPTGLGLNASSGLVTGTPTVVGDVTSIFTGSNNLNSADSNSVITSIIATPLAVPIFAGTIPNMFSNVGVPMPPYNASLNFQTGGSVETYSLQNAPAWMTINSSGQISGTPDAEAISAGITVTGTNTAGNDISNAWTMDAQAELLGRWELAWDGAESYAEFSSVVSATDFVISLTMRVDALAGGSHNLIGSGPTSWNSRALVVTNGAFGYRVGSGISHVSADGVVEVGVEYDVVMSRVGDQITVTGNGDVWIDVIEATGAMDSSSISEGPQLLFNGMIKDYHITNAEGDDVFFALDSNSTVSEESTVDANTLIFFNVVPEDWTFVEPVTGRNVLTFNADLASPFAVGQFTNVDCSGLDFNFSCSFNSITAAGAQWMCGVNGNSGVAVNAGAIQLNFSDGTSVLSAPGTVLAGTEYDLTVEYVESTTTVIATLNGLEVINAVVTTGWAVVNTIGARSTGTRAFSGVIKDVLLILASVGQAYFWAIDSGSIVSEDSLLDINTLVYSNVIETDWSVESPPAVVNVDINQMVIWLISEGWAASKNGMHLEVADTGESWHQDDLDICNVVSAVNALTVDLHQGIEMQGGTCP